MLAEDIYDLLETKSILEEWPDIDHDEAGRKFEKACSDFDDSYHKLYQTFLSGALEANGETDMGTGSAPLPASQSSQAGLAGGYSRQSTATYGRPPEEERVQLPSVSTLNQGTIPHDAPLPADQSYRGQSQSHYQQPGPGYTYPAQSEQAPHWLTGSIRDLWTATENYKREYENAHRAMWSLNIAKHTLDRASEAYQRDATDELSMHRSYAANMPSSMDITLGQLDSAVSHPQSQSMVQTRPSTEVARTRLSTPEGATGVMERGYWSGGFYHSR